VTLRVPNVDAITTPTNILTAMFIGTVKYICSTIKANSACLTLAFKIYYGFAHKKGETYKTIKMVAKRQKSITFKSNKAK